MKLFHNKVVVITGGNSGIGKVIAKSFYVQGDVTELSDLDMLYKNAVEFESLGKRRNYS